MSGRRFQPPPTRFPGSGGGTAQRSAGAASRRPPSNPAATTVQPKIGAVAPSRLNPPGPPPPAFSPSKAVQAKSVAGLSVIQPMLGGGTGGGDKRPGRPSREDRDRERFKKSKLKSVSKVGNTRASKAAFLEISKKINQAPEDIRTELLTEARRNTPPKAMGMYGQGDAIYSGKWRSFETDFAEAWWDDQPTPWTCYLCNAVINPTGTSDQQPTIEHLKPWATIKLGIPTQVVCKDGVHWTVALTKHVRSTLQDVNNLAPAHKGCNSSKNGPKNTDSLAPQKAGLCPGDTCALPRAD